VIALPLGANLDRLAVAIRWLVGRDGDAAIGGLLDVDGEGLVRLNWRHLSVTPTHHGVVGYKDNRPGDWFTGITCGGHEPLRRFGLALRPELEAIAGGVAGES